MRRFSDGDAERFVREYLKKDEQGFSEVLDVEYIITEGGPPDTCDSCAVGGGPAWGAPANYMDNFLVVCAKEAKVFDRGYNRSIPLERYSLLCMGWSESEGADPLGGDKEMYHCKYVRNDLYYAAYPSYEEFLAKLKPAE